MWKITNKLNSVILYDFRKHLIDPLLNAIFDYKMSSYKSLCDFIMSKNNQLLKISIKKSYKGVKFIEVLDSFSNNKTEYIKHQIEEYEKQNKSMDQLDYSICPAYVDNDLEKIFNIFFYESFFNDTSIWSNIDSNYAAYNRKKFHQNFIKENDLNVCPYCDIDTLYNIGNRVIEHFLPKSNFPFLSMHPFNLVSSCHSCNNYEGKKTKFLDKIVSPYNLQIGDKVSFKISHSDECINISSSYDEIRNYIKLLNLYERYSNSSIYNYLEIKTKQLFAIIHPLELNQISINTILLSEYINYKKEPLTFGMILLK